MTFLLSIFYFLLPFERIPTFEVAGFTIKFSYIVGVILIAYFLAKKPLKIFKDKPLLLSDKFLILFWAVGSLTIIRAENFKRSAILALLWTFVIIIYLILTRIIENQKTREKIENIIIWSAIITSLFGLYQFIGDSFDLPTKFTGLRYWYTKEIADLGLDDYLHGNGVCVVEWAEKGLDILPTEHLLIQINYLSDTERSFQLKPNGKRYLEIAKQLKDFLS